MLREPNLPGLSHRRIVALLLIIAVVLGVFNINCWKHYSNTIYNMVYKANI